MPTFVVTTPDGREYEVDAPEGATQEQVLAYAKQQAQPAPEEKPKRGMFDEATRQLGLTARNAVQGALGIAKAPGDLTAAAGRAFNVPFLEKFGSTQAVDSALTSLGLPQAETPQERVVGDITQGLAGVGGINALGGAMQKAATPGFRAVGDMLRYRPDIQAAAGVTGPAASGVTRELGGNELAQQAAGIGGSMLPSLGSGLFGMRDYARNQEKLAIEAQNPGRYELLSRARQAGYKVAPNQIGEDEPGTMLQGLSGKIKTNQRFSKNNSAVTDRLVRNELGLPPDVPLSPEVMESIRSNAGRAYAAVSNSGVRMVPTPNLRAVADQIRAPELRIAQMDPQGVNQGVMKIAHRLENIRPGDASAMVELVKRFRSDATANYKVANGPSPTPDAAALAHANRTAAAALEDMLRDNLARAGKQQLASDLIAARELIAKTHTIENALKGGHVDAAKLIKPATTGPATGGIKLAGEMADKFGFSMKRPDMSGGELKRSPLDWLAAGGVGGLAAGFKNPYVAAGAIPLLARPAARQYLLSDMLQNELMRPPVAGMSQPNLLPALGAIQSRNLLDLLQ